MLAILHFTFSPVTMNYVLKELRSINIRKTTGCDLIPDKLIKEGAHFLCKPIPSLINKCFDTCTFPNALKLADVVPIFKKINMLSKMNYRPISILSCISKMFEKLLISQFVFKDSGAGQIPWRQRSGPNKTSSQQVAEAAQRLHQHITCYVMLYNIIIHCNRRKSKM